jgi:hypothetical protein
MPAVLREGYTIVLSSGSPGADRTAVVGVLEDDELVFIPVGRRNKHDGQWVPARSNKRVKSFSGDLLGYAEDFNDLPIMLRRVVMGGYEAALERAEKASKRRLSARRKQLSQAIEAGKLDALLDQMKDLLD